MCYSSCLDHSVTSASVADPSLAEPISRGLGFVDEARKRNRAQSPERNGMECRWRSNTCSRGAQRAAWFPRPSPRQAPKRVGLRRCRYYVIPALDKLSSQQPAASSQQPAGPGSSLEERMRSGEFGELEKGSTKEQMTRPLRKLLANDPAGIGRYFALQLAILGRQWTAAAAKKMPVATGDIREIIGQPVFIPLEQLFRVYGKIFRLSFGPKNFVIISDPAYAKQILLTNADKYSKGILSEILDFVMGTGLIPADGEVWRMRRRAIVPAMHRKYVASMVGMFADCTMHGFGTLDKAYQEGRTVDMENYFSRLALDIIGKAVFNYDFDSLTHDDPIIQAVYTVLREAEHRSTAPIPYWNLPGAKTWIPRQRRCVEALKVVNDKLDALIAKCKQLVEDENDEFVEEFLSEADPSILHFLLASGDRISSKQLRDDLMTMLVAGHETTAAVLTWTLHLLGQHPDIAGRVREEVDRVVGDRPVTMEDIRELRFTTRVINESMRLYPQPPVLIRRALEADQFDQFVVDKGSDIFISVWNLHHSPAVWEEPERFNPDRFPLDGPVPNEVTENFAYLPFGGGRRKCIGDQFALFESIVALSMLMRRYEFSRPADAPPVGMTTGATIHTTNGLIMAVKPRQVAPSQGQLRNAELVMAHNGSSERVGGCPMGFGAEAAQVNGSGSKAGGCPMGLATSGSLASESSVMSDRAGASMFGREAEKPENGSSTGAEQPSDGNGYTEKLGNGNDLSRVVEQASNGNGASREAGRCPVGFVSSAPSEAAKVGVGVRG